MAFYRSWRFFLVAALTVAGVMSAGFSLNAQTEGRTPRSDAVNLMALAVQLEMAAAWMSPQKELQLTSPRGARLDFVAGSREIRINGRRVFLGEPVELERRQLFISRIDFETTVRPILSPASRPSPGPIRTIMIDPGHGGRDPGTRNPLLGLEEKELTLAVAFRLRDLLRRQGFRVELTRETDTFVALEERAARANAAKADLFISIHFNAVGNPAVHGTETYILTPRAHRSTGQSGATPGDLAENPGNDHDHWNALLGFLVHRQLLSDLGSFDRGLKRARFQVLREVNCPAVLVEAGYVSHPAEAARLATAEYQEELARSLAQAIQSYRRATERVGGEGR